MASILRSLSPLFCLVIGLLALSGCVNRMLDEDLPEERTLPSSFDTTPPDGPPIYRQGWSDGCESGLASASQLATMEFHQYQHRLDPHLARELIYQRVWKDAYDYCAFTMLTIMKYNQERL